MQLRLVPAGLGVALLSVVAIAAPPRRAVEPAPVVELGRFHLGGEGLPLVQENLVIEVEGQHVRTIANRTHENTEDGRVEGVMDMHLTENAHVTAFSYWNGRERIVGEVLPKRTAREIYESVVGRRRDPGLLEQIGPGRYLLHVYPIEPKEQKRSQIVWEQWLEQRSGRVSYSAPIDGTKTELTIELADHRTTRDFRSKTHDLTIEAAGKKTRVSARPKAKGATSIDLSWEIVASPFTMHGWVHRDTGEDGYVVLQVAAPEPKPSDRVPKDVTIVIDESGSMNGEPIEHTRKAAAAVVDALHRDDRLNVVLFDDRAEPLFSAPKPANDDTRQKARRFIEGAGNGGGTDIALAMTTALDAQAKDARPKSILLLTDGKSPREEAFAAVEADKRDVRLFTIGIGAQVDRPVLEHLASLKRGRFTTIEEPSAIEPTISQLYARMSAPVLVGLDLEAEGPSLVRTYPATLPDLFAGEEIVIAAKVQGTGRLDLKLTGTTSSGRKVIEHQLSVPKRADRPWVGSMWARSRIGDLLTRIELGQDGSEERVAEVTRLGVAYDIITPYTSFLAIPESELDERLRQMREDGRAGKEPQQEIIRRVVRGDELRNVPVGDTSSRDFSDAVIDGEALSPDAAPTFDSPGISLSAEHDYDESAPVLESSKRTRAGCAHCSTGDVDIADAWWLVVVVGLGRARRRGRVRATT